MANEVNPIPMGYEGITPYLIARTPKPRSSSTSAPSALRSYTGSGSREWSVTRR